MLLGRPIMAIFGTLDKAITQMEKRAILKGARQLCCMDCHLPGGTLVRVGPKGKDAKYRHQTGFCSKRN
jgi:hypothetical protein